MIIRALGWAAATILVLTEPARGAVEISGPVFPLELIGSRLPLGDNVFKPVVSRDGRYLVFQTSSGQLTADDNNDRDDVYLLDMAAGSYRRLSALPGNGDSNGVSVNPAISDDGKFVAFQSSASDLVNGDSNLAGDIFVVDLATGMAEIVSLSNAGEAANGTSENASISGDGRFVAFSSSADNLVASDSNSQRDIFVRDRMAGTTERVSVSSEGDESDAGSFQPSISANGRYVAFHSEATNFSNNEFDELPDIFLHDRVTGETRLINISTQGTRANADSARAIMTADGRFISYYSRATTLVSDPELFNVHFDIFVRDSLALETDLVSREGLDLPANGSSFNSALSEDGRYVVFESFANNLVPQDNNIAFDIFLFDRQTRQTRIISADGDRNPGNGSSSTATLRSDGLLVFFVSQATNFDPLVSPAVELFARDLGIAEPSRLSLATGLGITPDMEVSGVAISTDARFVLLTTAASNLVSGDVNNQADVFLYDRFTRKLRLVSGDSTGRPVDLPDAGASEGGNVSGDGCRAVFASDSLSASLGVAGATDSNNSSDIFLRDFCGSHPITLLSRSRDGNLTASAGSTSPTMSGDGSIVAFVSQATDLTALGNDPGVPQVYSYNTALGEIELVSRLAGGGAATQASDSPVVSADGRFIVFVGRDPDLDPAVSESQRPAPGDAAVYRYERSSGRTELICRGLDGAGNLAAPAGQCDQPALSTDGSVVAFVSTATNLTQEPATGVRQVFVWRETAAEINGIIALRPQTGAANGMSERPAVSPDGRLIAFQSDAFNWSNDDNNGRTDVIYYDLEDRQSGIVRGADGNIASGGASRMPVVGNKDADYAVGFISSAALVSSSQPPGTLYFQHLRPAKAEFTVEGSTDSPLQSVETGGFRLQVRNLGFTPVTSASGITVTFPQMDHPLVFADPPRWQCQQAPVLQCVFVGGPLLGDRILPGAAERLDLSFDMFTGTQALNTTVRLDADFFQLGNQPEMVLTTTRFQTGLAWSAAAPEQLPIGDMGTLSVAITNGGVDPVDSFQVLLATAVPGNRSHPVSNGTAGQFTCSAGEDPGANEWVCSYTGNAVPRGMTVELDLPFTLTAGSLDTLIHVDAEVEDITPGRGVSISTRADDLVFSDGFDRS